MTNTDRIASAKNIGRFSSTMLRQSGAQRKVVESDGLRANRFDLPKGNETFVPPDNLALSDNTYSNGYLQANTYNAIYSYFQSRGASQSNSATMAAIVIDTARMMDVPAMSIIENNTYATISHLAYDDLNALRTVSDQQHIVSDINNAKSIKARSIRA